MVGGKDGGWCNQETIEPQPVLQYGQLKILRKKRKLVRNVCQSGGAGRDLAKCDLSTLHHTPCHSMYHRAKLNVTILKRPYQSTPKNGEGRRREQRRVFHKCDASTRFHLTCVPPHSHWLLIRYKSKVES